MKEASPYTKYLYENFEGLLSKLTRKIHNCNMNLSDGERVIYTETDKVVILIDVKDTQLYEFHIW